MNEVTSSICYYCWYKAALWKGLPTSSATASLCAEAKSVSAAHKMQQIVGMACRLVSLVLRITEVWDSAMSSRTIIVLGEGQKLRPFLDETQSDNDVQGGVSLVLGVMVAWDSASSSGSSAHLVKCGPGSFS